MRIGRMAVWAGIAAIVASAAGPAAAGSGGWWGSIRVEGRHLGIGETVLAQGDVMFLDRGAADAARESGEFYAYLVQGVDVERINRARRVAEPKRWWTPPEEMTLVGDVTLSNWDVNLARATAHLEIPEMPEGFYRLMFCDLGCVNPLGNLIPSKVSVTSEVLAARTSRSLQALRLRVRHRVAVLEHRIRALRNEAEEPPPAAPDLSGPVDRLEAQVAALEAEEPETPWLAYAGWFAAGLASAVAFYLARLRRRATRVRVPDDARELVSTSPVG
ncbi:MAG: hypothetical protein M3273_08515 [Actinomycetota bacterium]|nr:hypothetical protein [Actinomycetota bacterium]